jgi:hypothetical protein
MASPAFERYIGIDYSGAQTPQSAIRGLRVYFVHHSGPPEELLPPDGSRKYWWRQGVAQWLVDTLRDGVPTLVGIDHGFSFPLRYFEQHGLSLDWPQFLEDFACHWPTHDPCTTVQHIREGRQGNGAHRSGNSRWRRLAEERAGGAKSVFHFDVPGSVAKSTHAGLPWLLHLRRSLGDALHMWPFDGWLIPSGRSAVAEVYPALWKKDFDPEGRSADQHDAYCVAESLRQADLNTTLARFLEPALTVREREVARVEGWVLGVR